MLLCSILTRPGDGRFSNFIINNGKLYSIDNDISFVEPVVSHMAWSISGNPVLFRSLFYATSTTLLDQEALQEFARLDRSAILDEWIEDVIQKEKEYTALFSEKEREMSLQ